MSLVSERVLIIAEVGVNHNGSVALAKNLIEEAANAGVDYVKFQSFKTESLVTRYAEKATYQKENLVNVDESQFSMLKKLELSELDHFELIRYAEKCGVKFLSTAFDLDSLNLLSRLGLNVWKIPSGEITNYLLLRSIALKKQLTILSTGMSNIQDIRNAIDVLIENGLERDQMIILHCNTHYPTPMGDVNLLAMNTIAREFGIRIGYSDHTLGIEVPIAAVALGATVIEKHFTLDRSMDGPDHKASLEPNELKSMVQAIRNVEIALGDGTKQASYSELGNISNARKSIVAKTVIKKGEVFSEENLTVKRPGIGISPMQWNQVVGQKAQRDFQSDELIILD
jgi:N,N'-diacetyllegionaminate synthase